MNANLIDIDELVLRCKDPEARKYIAEAVVCYKNGAYRACIVTTWIAVVYDFIHKLRQLELTGDKNAIGKLAEFERARNHPSPELALQFEKQILGWSHKEFEFLSSIQYDDLSRLMEDRNRCAHPSVLSDEEIYEPPAELARYHLRNAVTHLLQHSPVQGKSALESLQTRIESEFFPVNVDDAIQYFSHSALANAKISLIENFVKVLIKVLLKEEYDSNRWSRLVSALNAVRQMQPGITNSVFEDKLPEIVNNLEDDKLYNLVIFIYYIPDVSQFLNKAVVTRLCLYIEKVNFNDNAITVIDMSLDIDVLRNSAMIRISSIEEYKHKSLLLRNKPRVEYVDTCLYIYRISKNPFDWGKNKVYISDDLIIDYMKFFTQEQLYKVISLTINSDHKRSDDMINLNYILFGAFKRKVLTREQLNLLIEKFNLPRDIDFTIYPDSYFPF